MLHLTYFLNIVPGEPMCVYDGWCLKAGQLKKRPPERLRSQGGGEPEPFPGAIGRLGLEVEVSEFAEPISRFC